MFPPCTMYTPKMQPRARIQPTMTNMVVFQSLSGRATPLQVVFGVLSATARLL
jgi:hypothetical protein